MVGHVRGDGGWVGILGSGGEMGWWVVLKVGRGVMGIIESVGNRVVGRVRGGPRGELSTYKDGFFPRHIGRFLFVFLKL